MKSINLPQAHQSDKRRTQLSVMPLGFGVALEDKLKNLFQVEWQGDRVYTIASPHAVGRVDILLVNYDNPSALHKKNALISNSCPDAHVVAVSQGPLSEPPKYHIRGMLTASRLLGVLDRIPVHVPGAAHSAIPAQVIEQRIRERVQERAKLQALSNIVETPYAASVAASTATKTYRALVVDDSIAIQKSLELKLATLEQIALIDFADSGESALEKAEAGQYDLIFLDVMMPGIDGYETCTQLRKKAGYKKTPIIMVSGKTSPLDEVKGVIAGCTTYLTKPVQDEAFNKLSLRVLAWLEAQ